MDLVIYEFSDLDRFRDLGIWGFEDLRIMRLGYLGINR